MLAAVGAKDDGTEPVPVPAGGGHEIETRIAHEAGFHAIRLRHLAEQRIAVGQPALADGQKILAEVMAIFRKLPQQGGGEDGDVARGGDMALVEKAVGVHEVAAVHAEPLSLRIHVIGECTDVSGGGLRQNIGHVIGRIDKQGLQGEIDAHRLAHRHADLAGRLGMGEFGHGDLLIEPQLAGLQLLEHHIGGHQLGKGGRVPGLAGTILRENFLRGGIEQKGWPGRESGRRGAQQKQRQNDDASENRQAWTIPRTESTANTLCHHRNRSNLRQHRTAVWCPWRDSNPHALASNRF